LLARRRSLGPGNESLYGIMMDTKSGEPGAWISSKL